MAMDGTPVRPLPIQPEPVHPDPIKPDPIKPGPIDPDPIHPDPIKPDPIHPDPVKPQPVAVRSYTFLLKSMNILNLRSQTTDTDYASFTLRVKRANGSGTTTTGSKKLGDLKVGGHAIGLSFKETLGPGDAIALNYIVVNAGHADPITVQSTIEAGGARLSTGWQVFKTLMDFTPGGPFGQIVLDIAGVFADIFDGPNCDGTVAVEQELLTFTDLPTTSAPVMHTTTHPGTYSPHGCGKNSIYEVTWGIEMDA